MRLIQRRTRHQVAGVATTGTPLDPQLALGNFVSKQAGSICGNNEASPDE
jgi:hypothetical protein